MHVVLKYYCHFFYNHILDVISILFCRWGNPFSAGCPALSSGKRQGMWESGAAKILFATLIPTNSTTASLARVSISYSSDVSANKINSRVDARGYQRRLPNPISCRRLTTTHIANVFSILVGISFL